MKPRLMEPRRLPCAAALAVLFAAPLLTADVLDKTKSIAGTTVHYKVILPPHYDAAKVYPGILAFGGGSQTMQVVEGTITRFYREQAEQRGYIVILPAAPDGRLFFEGGERIFPEFLDKILADYKIQDNKFHVTGMSNGGISAFHVAASNPKYFWSITVFPGYLPEATPARVSAISRMCVNMYVGELDTGWLEDMQRQASQLKGNARNSVESRDSRVTQSTMPFSV